MLSSEHRKFMIVEQMIVPFFINTLINAAITWLLFRSTASVPLWGMGNASFDLGITGLMIPFATCMIVSRVIAGQVRSGKVSVLPREQIPASGWSHRPILARALLLGGAGILLAALPVIAALNLADTTSFPSGAFIAFKAGWGGLLGAVVSPIIGWWALAAASREAAKAH